MFWDDIALVRTGPHPSLLLPNLSPPWLPNFTAEGEFSGLLDTGGPRPLSSSLVHLHGGMWHDTPPTTSRVPSICIPVLPSCLSSSRKNNDQMKKHARKSENSPRASGCFVQKGRVGYCTLASSSGCQGSVHPRHNLFRSLRERRCCNLVARTVE